uniref:Monooxygenase, DBH-like 1, like n=1 Tax=Nothobranchius pienaari TaxID=704102 RepID=A0A1A8LHW7_9TELE
MDNADIVMGGAGSSGNYFKDYFSTGEAMPVADTKQSYTLLSMSENNSQTVMTFQRPINTADNQDFLITNQPILVIYAYGLTDTIQYHDNRRGHKQLNLLNYTGSDKTTTLSNSMYLDSNELVNLKWGFDNPQGNITFQLTVNTTGWLGFGFSANGDMDNADIVMGGAGSSGNYFKDYFSTGEAMPVADTKQSYTLLSMSENNSQTVMTFQRPINTADNQDFLITNQPILVIYAYGLTDTIQYHDNRRGHKQLNLLNYTGSDKTTTLSNSMYLDSNELVNLKWGFDNPQGNITFQLTINTVGWLGFGFSANGGMDDADIVMGGVGSNGNYFKDYYSTGEVMPVADTTQSYTLLSVAENNGQTVMTFQRPVNTNDNQDFQITDKSIYIIYAYGLTDEIAYHEKRRGHKQVNLFNYNAASQLCTSWIVIAGAFVLLLLWIDIM